MPGHTGRPRQGIDAVTMDFEVEPKDLCILVSHLGALNITFLISVQCVVTLLVLSSSGSSCFETNDFHLHLQRQFSEDSGFSSCGSSASSVADDIDTVRGPVPKSFVYRSTTQRRLSAVSFRQSSTVASVLAAGVSDSEETDQFDSDEDVSHQMCSSVAV